MILVRSYLDLQTNRFCQNQKAPTQGVLRFALICTKNQTEEICTKKTNIGGFNYASSG
jgi:hypothetical protein